MTYVAPIEEQKFVLRHVVGIDRLAEAGFEVSEDMVDAIVEGVGAFAAGEFAPLNRVGDTVGARWSLITPRQRLQPMRRSVPTSSAADASAYA